MLRVIGQFVEVIPCTSSREACRVSDISIVDLTEAGLTKATKARTGHVVRIDRSKIVDLVGYLSPQDMNGILNSKEVA